MGTGVATYQHEHHRAAVLALLRDRADHDAAVPALTELELEARFQHPDAEKGHAWRVHTGPAGVDGAMLVSFVGTKRTSLLLAVAADADHPAVAGALLDAAPRDKRLLTTCRASDTDAVAFFQAAGFVERYRDVRLRREAHDVELLDFPAWASFEVDGTLDADRLAAALVRIHGDDAERDIPTLQARIARPGTRLLYLKTPDGDHGLCIVTGAPQVEASMREPSGRSKVGLLEEVGLSKSVQKKGLSRPLVRAGLDALREAGFAYFEVTADRRRQAAVELYEREGFAIVDEDVHLMRKDDA